MNATAFQQEIETRPAILPCARPGCPNLVREAWEETGTLCARCAVEGELYDREARYEAAREVRRLHG
jgi:hypothetical protein